MEALLREDRQTRAELARSLDVSTVTVGKIVDDLMRQGVIEERDDAEAAPDGGASAGRPARPVGLQRRAPRVVAAELSRRWVRLAALPIGAGREAPWQASVPMSRSQPVLTRRLREAKRALGVDRPWAVAVSTPGVTDDAGGRVLFSPNLHWTEGFDLPAMFGSVWGAPVCVVQEIRAAALAHRLCAGVSEDFLLVDFGEGLGGAAVVDGRLYQGAVPLSAEIGHVVRPGNPRRCGCGARGCLETLASVRGVKRSYKEATGDARPTWGRMVKRVESHGIEPWLAETLEASGETIGGALNVLGLRHVAITGWPTRMPEAVGLALGHCLERSTLWARFGRVTWTLAPRRRVAGLLAAAIDRVVLAGDGCDV